MMGIRCSSALRKESTLKFYSTRNQDRSADENEESWLENTEFPVVEVEPDVRFDELNLDLSDETVNDSTNDMLVGLGSWLETTQPMKRMSCVPHLLQLVI